MKNVTVNYYSVYQDKDGTVLYENNDPKGSFRYWDENGKVIKTGYTPDGIYVNNLGIVPSSTFNS